MRCAPGSSSWTARPQLQSLKSGNGENNPNECNFPEHHLTDDQIAKLKTEFGEEKYNKYFAPLAPGKTVEDLGPFARSAPLAEANLQRGASVHGQEASQPACACQ